MKIVPIPFCIIHRAEDVTALVKAEQREAKIKGRSPIKQEPMAGKNNIQQDALRILNAAPDNYLILLPDAPRFSIVGVTDSYLKATYTRREDILGKGLFEVFPDNPDLQEATGVQNLSASLYYVLEHKREHRMADQRYDVPNPEGGEFVYKVWRPLNRPVLNDKGEVQYILHNVEDVTVLVKAEQVEENEERLHSALEAANMGTWDYNPATNTVIASDEFKRIFGLSPDQEFTYEFLINNVIEEDRAHTHQVNQDVLHLKNGQSNYDLQYRIRRINDGELRWIRSIGKVHVNEEGKPYRFTGTLFDITREKKAEERYQNIFEGVQVSIWEKDYSNMVVALQKLKQQYGQGLKKYLQDNKEEVYRLMSLVKINDTNSASLKMFEAESKEQLLKGLPVVFTEEALPAFIDELMAIANKDKSFQAEYALQTLKRRKIICFTTITFPQNNDYSSVLVSRSDISDLKKAESALKESEERFRTMANSIPQLAWMTDEKGWIYWYNDRWYDYTGTTPKEMLGWGWRKVHHPDLVEGVVRRFTEAIEAGRPWEDIFLLRSREGEYRWFLSRSIPVRKEDGTLIGWFGTNTDITEQRKTEEALKRSEEQLLLAMEGGELGFFDYDPPTGTLIWSARTKEMFGLPPDAPVDYNVYLSALHPEDRERAHAAVQKALEPEIGGYENIYRVVGLKDGRLRWLRSKAKAFFDEQGKAYRLAGVTMDITKQKEAEEALKQSESNLRNLVLQAPVAMCIGNGPSFIVEVANDRMLELWGKRPEEIMGRPVFDVLTEAGEQGLKQVIQQVYATAERFTANEMPVFLPRNDKVETVYVNFVYEPIKNSDGAVTEIIAVAIDVTDQVVARKEIEESHKEFQFAMDFVPQIIWLTRPDGYHYYYNKQWYDYTGLTYGETKGEGWNHVFHPDDQERAWELWRHSLATGDSYEIEYRCRRYDGQYRWFLGRALPLRDETGTIIKWFGTCTDIHDQKTFAEVLEKQVEERTKELHRSNEDLQQFVHVASHDLKEPIRKIKTFIGILQAEINEQLNEKNRYYLNRVQVAADRMFSMIDGVLTYSTISAWEERYEPVDLNEMIKNVEFDLELAIQQKGATIHYAHLPKLEGAPVMLQQVFYNLISNSLKFARTGVPPVITITSETIDQKGKAFARIVLQDNGIGFEQKYAEKIFGTFIRLHPKDKYEGAGLGLSLCKKIVERHGGSIAAKSAENVGTAFEILLPIKRVNSVLV
jgi:PAS domain S-box-containing protein